MLPGLVQGGDHGGRQGAFSQVHEVVLQVVHGRGTNDDRVRGAEARVVGHPAQGGLQQREVVFGSHFAQLQDGVLVQVVPIQGAVPMK